MLNRPRLHAHLAAALAETVALAAAGSRLACVRRRDAIALAALLRRLE